MTPSAAIPENSVAGVELRNIVKHFGEVKAVDGVDLTGEDGEFLVLLGPSGCGKSTLLRMIAGLETPTLGDIFIGDQRVTDLPPQARGIAMVFQNYALYPHLSVFKNIAFPLKARKLPKADIEGKVEWAAAMLGLERLLGRKPRELSGGERQRVALARAIVREPNVFLLDEPLSNLDAKLRATARAELHRFQREIGITTVYVTHDQVEAMGMGDRIAVMHEGKIRQLDTPTEIYRNPADTFVAGFLGSPPINLITKRETIVGFRPESFLPAEAYEDNHDLEFIQFAVDRTEYLGSDLLVYGNLDEQFHRSPAVAKLPAGLSVHHSPGETHRFAVPRDSVKFFDARTGLRTDRRIS